MEFRDAVNRSVDTYRRNKFVYFLSEPLIAGLFRHP